MIGADGQKGAIGDTGSMEPQGKQGERGKPFKKAFDVDMWSKNGHIRFTKSNNSKWW